MRFCPKCQAKYDEEIIKFCTKDGTPLAEENPTFTAMPSQSSIDDIGEETIISRNRPIIPLPAPVVGEPDEPVARVVIPIGEEKKQTVRQSEKTSSPVPPPAKSNMGMVVFLTIFGTMAILGAAAGGWWFLSGSGGTAANTNSNSNVTSNTDVNYNPPPSDLNSGNTSSNTNSIANATSNSNSNVKTPTPTPTKTPTPKPTNTNVNSNTAININGNKSVNITPSNSNTSTNVKPSPTPLSTAKPSPTPTKSPANKPSNVSLGVMNNRATSLAKPTYPPIAKQMGASGQVVVQISVDEAGNVVAAKAISGHALLRGSAENAARQSRFNPIKIDDKPVRANGTVVYNFIN